MLPSSQLSSLRFGALHADARKAVHLTKEQENNLTAAETVDLIDRRLGLCNAVATNPSYNPYTDWVLTQLRKLFRQKLAKTTDMAALMNVHQALEDTRDYTPRLMDKCALFRAERRINNQKAD